MNRILIFALLPVTLGANANCLTDGPEIGDVGPDSELVCNELVRQFPGATMAVENRFIHSPTEVTVTASVNGEPISLEYTLAGFTWGLNVAGTRTADTTARPSNRPGR